MAFSRAVIVSRALRITCGRYSYWLALSFGLLNTGCRTMCPRSLEQNVVTARQASLQGLDYMQQGRWDEAERTFAGAVKSCPVDERARSCFAETLWQRGARDQALTHMREAVKLSGNDPQRLVRLGEMHLALGNTDDAFRCAEEALAKNSRLSHAWALRGDAEIARGHNEEALCDYHRSLAYNRHQPRVQLAMAEIYARQDRTQRALSTLETLADQYPPGEVPTNVLAMQGNTLLRMGRNHDAVEVLAKASQQGTPSADLLCSLAKARLAVGDAGEARETLAAALAHDPQHREATALSTQIDEKQQIMTARMDSLPLR